MDDLDMLDIDSLIDSIHQFVSEGNYAGAQSAARRLEIAKRNTKPNQSENLCELHTTI